MNNTVISADISLHTLLAQLTREAVSREVFLRRQPKAEQGSLAGEVTRAQLRGTYEAIACIVAEMPDSEIPGLRSELSLGSAAWLAARARAEQQRAASLQSRCGGNAAPGIIKLARVSADTRAAQLEQLLRAMRLSKGTARQRHFPRA